MIRSTIPLCLLGAFLVLTTPVDANAQKNKKSALKTTHVTLYDCGLAQFERRAEVRGAMQLDMTVTLAHLDDMLASLVLATDDAVSVQGVNYPSVQNLGQAVAASGLAHAMSYDDDEYDQLTMPGNLSGYIEALIGTSVEIQKKNGTRAAGTVLDCVDQDGEAMKVEKTGTDQPPVKSGMDKILVLVDAKGKLSWIPLVDINAISPSSNRESAAIHNFSSQLGKAGGFTETSITIETGPGSRGNLAAAYIRQAPMWRMTYKLTAHQDHVVLEAWALVHNDTADDWKEVEMTLVSGLPESYVVSLASPRYGQREGIQLEGEGNMMPQLGAYTPDSLLYDLELHTYGTAYGYGGLGLSGTGRGGGGSGYGSIGSASSGTIGYGAGSSSLLVVGSPAAEEQMEAAVEAEISTYRVLSKVTIPAGTSSMVPVIRKKLSGKAFTLIADGNEPSTCFKVENGTGLVLQGGLGSFYINGRFRGETEIHRTEPGEERIWCFGGDPDIDFFITRKQESVTKAIDWWGEMLRFHSLRTTKLTYNLENLAGQPRKIALQIDHIPNGRVVSPKDVEEGRVSNQKLLIFEIGARTETQKSVTIEEGIMHQHALAKDILEEALSLDNVPKEQRAVAKEALGHLLAAEDANAEKQVKELRVGELEEVLTRDQETLKTISNARGQRRMVRKILQKVLDTQARIDDLKQEIKADIEAAALAKDTATVTMQKLERK